MTDAQRTLPSPGTVGEDPPSQVVALTTVRVPVQAILYLQAMAENGDGDQPKPRGPALPSNHVRYWQ